MRWREFIGLLSHVSSWPFAAHAQEANKAYRVGSVTDVGSVARLSDPNHARVRPFLQGMRDLGFVEGINLVLERRSAEGVTGRGANIATDLTRGGIGVIVATTLLAADARCVSSTTPVVMAASTDPVERGLAASLPRPGGNVTGFTVQAGPDPMYRRRPCRIRCTGRKQRRGLEQLQTCGRDEACAKSPHQVRSFVAERICEIDFARWRSCCL